nr:mitogen-activated protein kinase 4b-like isoform X3 [Physcomitrium patens]|eukprot:XP_024396997.1 mitogen-activated protein kinase 4b-like isoform X3 [Physcomitrella patens]
MVFHTESLGDFFLFSFFFLRFNLNVGSWDRLSSVCFYERTYARAFNEQMNMQVLFGPHEWPAEEKTKQEEMVSHEARFIFVEQNSTSEASSLDEGDSMVGFVHFKFGLEHDVPVLYVYEMQLKRTVQGVGLGKFLMQLLELVARKNNMKAILVAVHKRNSRALAFYNGSLGYKVATRSSSTQKNTQTSTEMNYEILCKTFDLEDTAVVERQGDQNCESREESGGEATCQPVDAEDQVLEDSCPDMECESSIENVPNLLQGMRYTQYYVRDDKFEVYDKYVMIGPIGHGAYGDVCAFTNKETGEKVAIKKIGNAFQNHTTARRTLREILLLRHTEHDNIIPIRDIIVPANIEDFEDAYIANELMDTDLHQIVRSTKLDEYHCQFLLYQLLRGLKYIHSANILHRDLKPSNLLINCNDCLLKICDFGLARTSAEDDFLTEYVVTRPYRAPELLLGSRMYTAAVDMWSVGCIFMEMLTGQPLFPIRSRQEHPVNHLKLITELLGTPDASDLSFLQNPDARQRIQMALIGQERKPLFSRFPQTSAAACDLAEKMLRFNPSNRITAEDALAHPYLSALHDVSDEPTCHLLFDFDAYLPNLSVDHVKTLIWREATLINAQ